MQERKRKPLAPYITSKLQQDAANRLGFTSQKTMIIAQQLYEGIDISEEGPTGLITYMRTDSTRVAESAIQVVRKYIVDTFKRGIPAGKAELLREQEGSAGRPRGDTAHGRAADP